MRITMMVKFRNSFNSRRYIDDGYSGGGMQLSVIPENDDIIMENSGIDYNENNINNNTSGQKMEENNIMLRDYNTAPPALGNKVGSITTM